jgi:uncharacterized membrane protein
MSNLIVLGFDNMEKAAQVRDELIKLQKEHLIALEDAAVVVRDSEGKIKIEQAVNLAAAGAINGGLWGTLIGLLFLNPLLGLVVGAGAGALSGSLSDIGINDDFIKEVGNTITPGTSALFVLVKQITTDKVMEDILPYGPKLIRTSLTHDDEMALLKALMPKDTAAS